MGGFLFCLYKGPRVLGLYKPLPIISITWIPIVSESWPQSVIVWLTTSHEAPLTWAKGEAFPIVLSLIAALLPDNVSVLSRRSTCLVVSIFLILLGANTTFLATASKNPTQWNSSEAVFSFWNCAKNSVSKLLHSAMATLWEHMRFEIEAVGITLESSTFGWGLFQLWLSTILVSSGWPGAEDISCCELSNFQPFALRDSSGPDTLAATVLASTDKRLLASKVEYNEAMHAHIYSLRTAFHTTTI